MSNKRARRHTVGIAARRFAMGAVVAALATVLVATYLDRRGHEATVAVSTQVPPSTAPPAHVAALNGTYDVELRVGSVAYGATWPGPTLSVDQTVAQRWTIECRESSCRLRVVSGHVVEDPDDATVTTADDRSFTASATTPASTDTSAVPPGCGSVNATDVQRLTLATNDGGATFAGSYEVHHPVIHVEGPVGDGTGTCDSFDLVVGITASRTTN